MKIQHQIEIDGVTATLSVEASRDALRRLSEDSKGVCTDYEIEDCLLGRGHEIHALLMRELHQLRSSLLHETSLALHAETERPQHTKSES